MIHVASLLSAQTWLIQDTAQSYHAAAMNETLTLTSDANASGRGYGYTFLDTLRVPDLGKPYGSVFEICISTGTHEDHILSKQAPHALMGFQQGDGFAQDTPNCTARSSLIRPSCNSGITGVLATPWWKLYRGYGCEWKHLQGQPQEDLPSKNLVSEGKQP